MLPIIYLIVMVNSIDRGIHPHHGCPGGKAEGVWDEPVIVVLCGVHSPNRYSSVVPQLGIANLVNINQY